MLRISVLFAIGWLSFSNIALATGDCDGNGTVTISEVQSAINMFLGLKPPVVCVDEDFSNIVSISEVQKTINTFLGLISANTIPLANAGIAQSVVTGTVVTLDGSASTDANSEPLTYSWSFASMPSGSSATLSNATFTKPTFTPDVAGAYVLNLVVNDGKANSAVATITISVKDSLAGYAYVVNYGSNSVSAYSINATTGALNSIGTFATKTNFSSNPLPQSLTVDPSGKFAYVSNWNSNNIDIFSIDANTGSLTSIATVAAGKSPFFVAFDPTGKFAFAANMNSNYGSAYSVDATTGVLTSIGNFAAGKYPSPVTFDPSGRFAYMSTYNGVSRITSTYTLNAITGSLTSISTVDGGNSYEPINIDPSGKFAYVSENGTVSAYSLDATTGALTSIGVFVAGTSPQSFAFDPLGQFAYVANFGANTFNGATIGNVSAFTIDATNGSLTSIGTFATGSQSQSIAIDPSGKFVYVVNYTGTVSAYIYSSTTGALTSIGTFATGRMPVFITTKR
jgi:YVTN family beta-propeller protein